MPSAEYIDPEWKERFRQSGYTTFEDWWNAEGSLVEEGNFRGADKNTSWSHVCRLSLDDGRTVYLKRQQNHFPNNLVLKLRRIPTFEIEWRNYQKLRDAGIPTLKIIYFSSRKTGDAKQCIIVSEELKDMTSAHDLIRHFQSHGWPDRQQRLAMVGAVVTVVRKMHDAGMIHNALYARHIYFNISLVDGKPQFPGNCRACLIDLERTKFPGPGSPKLITHDLEKMFRRIRLWPARDCLWFFKRYLGLTKLTPEAKAVARQIAATRS